MRRLALRLTALAHLIAIGCLAGALPPSTPALAQAAGKQAPTAKGATGQPPHAWLFGTWTGGIFPTPSTLTAEACLSQPVVIFTRDVVLRATLTDEFYSQRLIETVLTSARGAQFRFTRIAAAMSSGGMLGPGAAPSVGFGCDSPDTLEVERRTDNEINFPGCADFPYPLVRCPAR